MNSLTFIQRINDVINETEMTSDIKILGCFLTNRIDINNPNPKSTANDTPIANIKSLNPNGNSLKNIIGCNR